VVLVFAVIILCLIPVLLKFTQNWRPTRTRGDLHDEQLAATANLDYLNAYTDQFTPMFKAFPEYYSSFQINGFNGVQPASAASCSSRGTSASTQMELLPLVQASFHKSAACRSSASTCRRCPAPARACRSSS
jgi:multidrug efflux pump